ncbi:MAG: UDP-N-acetylglucosamine 2-epimerase, partial [bacterium]|nr:UDP-N-acetylglucosamine 2-epimerase [bacterium]
MTRKKRKILYISGTRADYGLIRETLFLIGKNPKLKVEIVATGMHLMPQFGNTLKEVKKDGFKTHIINAIFEKDDRKSQAKFIGKFILEFLEKIPKINPDIIFIQGDRPEMLAAATAGVYLGIPVAHSHGGEVTSTVDEITRHAISKLSHIHFVSTKKSAERLIKMGEDSWRVFVTGAPGLDVILKRDIFSAGDIAKKYKLNLKEPVILALQHPVTADIDNS